MLNDARARDVGVDAEQRQRQEQRAEVHVRQVGEERVDGVEERRGTSSPMAATGDTSPYRSASAASTFQSSCVLGDALGITWATLPSPSMMKVERRMPMYVLP